MTLRPATGRSRMSTRFARNAEGSTMVEFAFIALPLFLLVFAILELGWGNFVQSRLDAATQQAARQVMTGAAQAARVSGQPLTAAQFRDQFICPKLPASMACADVYVNVSTIDPTQATPFSPFVNATGSGLVAPDLAGVGNAYALGAGRNYVVLQVAYPLKTFAGALLSNGHYAGKSVRVLMSTSTFKNEPFPNS